MFSAASLKRVVVPHGHDPAGVFSAGVFRGLIEAGCGRSDRPGCGRFPRGFSAASLKPYLLFFQIMLGKSFPRVFSAASLKRDSRPSTYKGEYTFSAGVFRGLIEA